MLKRISGICLIAYALISALWLGFFVVDDLIHSASSVCAFSFVHADAFVFMAALLAVILFVLFVGFLLFMVSDFVFDWTNWGSEE